MITTPSGTGIDGHKKSPGWGLRELSDHANTVVYSIIEESGIVRGALGFPGCNLDRHAGLAPNASTASNAALTCLHVVG